MKNKIQNNNMLVAALVATSFLFLLGITLGAAQDNDNMEGSPLFDIRTGNAIDNPAEITVSYINKNVQDTANELSTNEIDDNGGENSQCGLWSWLVLTCQGQWTCQGSSGVTCEGGWSCGAGQTCTIQGQSTCQGTTCHAYANTCYLSGCTSAPCMCGKQSTYVSGACIGPAPKQSIPEPICLTTTYENLCYSLAPTPGCWAVPSIAPYCPTVV